MIEEYRPWKIVAALWKLIPKENKHVESASAFNKDRGWGFTMYYEGVLNDK